ncbi:MAG: tyrosine-type recombinase/integrase [Actinomycetia bacterium]|nr:tyrosine-type recombinase/integrase [Actinomycetes bacterium]
MDPDKSLGLYIKYIKYEKNLTKNSIRSYKEDIAQLISFLKDKDILNLDYLDLSVFRGFLKSLDSKKYANRTMVRKYSSYINYFRFLEDNKIINTRLSQLISVPRRREKYYTILSRSEIKRVFGAMKAGNSLEVRDRLILELIYSTGARVSEVENIMMEDINIKNNEIKVTGKGRKQRIVYINNTALYWIDRYIKDARRKLSFDKNSQSYSGDRHLLLNSRGKGLTSRSIREIVKKNVRFAGIKKNITPHSLRHSFATHLLQEGAGIREIQELLGHESITTTEIYSHMDIEKLRADYRKFHPRSKIK